MVPSSERIAGERVVQNDATPENVSRAAFRLLKDPAREQAIRPKLAAVTASLGDIVRTLGARPTLDIEQKRPVDLVVADRAEAE